MKGISEAQVRVLADRVQRGEITREQAKKLARNLPNDPEAWHKVIDPRKDGRHV